VTVGTSLVAKVCVDTFEVIDAECRIGTRPIVGTTCRSMLRR
jgi:hypothetical protein